MKLEPQNVVLLLLNILHEASGGGLVRMPSDIFDMGRVIRNTTQNTLTGCYMECRKNMKCGSIGLTKTLDQNLYICHLLKAPEKNEIELYQNSSLQLKTNNLIGSIATWNKDYQVRFRFKIDPLKYEVGHYNILHFTTGRDSIVCGSRIPSIYFVLKVTGVSIIIKSCVNGDKGYRVEIPLDDNYYKDWIHLDIAQFFDECFKKYIFRVKIDGKVFREVGNNDTRIFKNVKIFASLRWLKEALKVEIRNLFIRGGVFKNKSSGNATIIQ